MLAPPPAMPPIATDMMARTQSPIAAMPPMMPQAQGDSVDSNSDRVNLPYIDQSQIDELSRASGAVRSLPPDISNVLLPGQPAGSVAPQPVPQNTLPTPQFNPANTELANATNEFAGLDAKRYNPGEWLLSSGQTTSDPSKAAADAKSKVITAPGANRDKKWSTWDKIASAITGWAQGGLVGGIQAGTDRNYFEKMSDDNARARLLPQIEMLQGTRKADQDARFGDARIIGMQTEAERDRASVIDIAARGKSREEEAKLKAEEKAAAPGIAKQKAYDKRFEKWTGDVQKTQTQRNAVTSNLAGITSSLLSLESAKVNSEAELKKAGRPADRNRIKTQIKSYNDKIIQANGKATTLRE